MKKALLLVLALVLVISLAACGGNGNDNGNGGNSTNPPASNGGNDPTSAPGNNGNNNGGDKAEGYPDYWNDEIPKLNGTVTFEMQLGENNVQTFINVKNKGVIDAYIDALISKGYEKYVDTQDNTNTNIAVKNGTWSIYISYRYIDGDNDLEGVKFNYSPDVS